MSAKHTASTEIISLDQSVRIVLLVDAAESAGLAPMQVRQLHMMAYFSNVLAPVWDIPPIDGKILKRNGGPFYPSIQKGADRLVGQGVLTITDLGHILDEDNRWRLAGSYSLHRRFADRIIERATRFREELRLRTFIQELAYTFSILSKSQFSDATKEDATYSDSLIDNESVLDFAEWRDVNYSARAAGYFAGIMPSGSYTTPGEKLHMYVRHLRERMVGEKE